MRTKHSKFWSTSQDFKKRIWPNQDMGCSRLSHTKLQDTKQVYFGQHLNNYLFMYSCMYLFVTKTVFLLYHTWKTWYSIILLITSEHCRGPDFAGRGLDTCFRGNATIYVKQKNAYCRASTGVLCYAIKVWSCVSEKQKPQQNIKIKFLSLVTLCNVT